MKIEAIEEVTVFVSTTKILKSNLQLVHFLKGYLDIFNIFKLFHFVANYVYIDFHLVNRLSLVPLH